MTDPRIDGPLPDETAPVGVYRTVVPYVGRPVTLTILSERITSVITHWLTKQEAPPAGRDTLHHHDGCKRCIEGRQRRWKGYVMAWDHEEGQYRIPTFSFDGAGLLLRMAGPGRPLRGLAVSMVRLGRSNSNPIWWGHSDRAPLDPLPEAPDILPSLVKMYGMEVVEQIERAREEQASL